MNYEFDTDEAKSHMHKLQSHRMTQSDKSCQNLCISVFHMYLCCIHCSIFRVFRNHIEMNMFPTPASPPPQHPLTQSSSLIVASCFCATRTNPNVCRERSPTFRVYYHKPSLAHRKWSKANVAQTCAMPRANMHYYIHTHTLNQNVNAGRRCWLTWKGLCS